jgi:hypothetical protein
MNANHDSACYLSDTFLQSVPSFLIPRTLNDCASVEGHVNGIKSVLELRLIENAQNEGAEAVLTIVRENKGMSVAESTREKDVCWVSGN